MTDILGKLLDLLDLEQIELDIFRGRSPDDRRQRVFGGQVAGQALMAASQTVDPGRGVHSLHSYFLRPGDPHEEIRYAVERLRDGRSFTTRRVVAWQRRKGEDVAIFTLTADYTAGEAPLVEHALPMPDVPGPDGLPGIPEMVARHPERGQGMRVLGGGWGSFVGASLDHAV